MEKKDDHYVRLSYDFDETVCWGFENWPITSVTAIKTRNKDWFFYSTPGQVFSYQRWIPREKRTLIFKLKSDLMDSLNELPKTWLRDDETGWQNFDCLFKRLQLRLPRDYLAEIVGAKLTETNKREVVRDVERAMRCYLTEKEGFSALAFADGILFAGCRNGSLIIPDEHLQQEGKHAVRQFRYPINAMCTIDEETMESGIRQKVTRNIQMKAVHAKQKPVAMRKAA